MPITATNLKALRYDAVNGTRDTPFMDGNHDAASRNRT